MTYNQVMLEILLRFRKTLRFTQLILVIVAIGSSCIGAEPVKLIVGGSRIFLHTEPVLVDGTVYAPLTALSALGAKYQTDENEKRDDQKIRITPANGKEFICRARLIGNALMLPIRDIAPELGAEASWDPKTLTLSLRAKVESIEFDGLELRVLTSFPIKFEPDFWASAGKLILDLHGVSMPTKQEDVPLKNNTSVPIRTGVRNNNETGRIVLDLGKRAKYRVLSSRKTSRVSLLISPPTGEDQSSSPTNNFRESDNIKALPSETHIPDNSQAPSMQESLVTVNGVTYQTQDSCVEVRVSTSGKAKYVTSMSRNPNQLVLDIDNSVLGQEFEPLQVGHEVLDTVRTEQFSANKVRITMDLNRIVGWDIRQTFGEILINLMLPKGAGGSLAEKTIVIDPGHGGNDPGAIGLGGWKEKDSNYAIAEKVRKVLTDAGACALLTRGPDNRLDLDKAKDLAKRGEFAARHSADIFISIHGNSVAGSNCPSGIETYYHGYDPNGRTLAYCVHSELIRESGLPDLRVRSDYTLYQTGLGVLRSATGYGVPAILVELGYVKHPGDVKKLQDPDFQQRMAEAIVRGIKAYIEGN